MRILLVEDDIPLADLLSRALREAQFAVDCMHDGIDADHVLRTQHYAAVILDLGLPRLSGVDVLRRLRARNAKLPVLIISARGSVQDRVQGLNLGADDYLPKPFELSELEARLRALIRRAHGHDSPIVSCGSLQYDGNTRLFSMRNKRLALTPREHAVLEVLMMGLGKTVSKDRLAEQIFTLDQESGAEAIEIYVHRLRKKLTRSDVSIVTLRGLGYMLEARRGRESSV